MRLSSLFELSRLHGMCAGMIGGGRGESTIWMCAAEFGPLAHVCTSQEIHDFAAQLTAPGGWIAATRIEEGGLDPVSGYGGFGVNSCAAHIGGSSTDIELRLLVDESGGGKTRRVVTEERG